MPKSTWHVCHHCDGVGCEVCEEGGGWFETAAERDARLEDWGRPTAGIEIVPWERPTLCVSRGAEGSDPRAEA